MHSGTDILILLGLVVLNGFFAMAELAIVSSRRGRLRAMTAKRVPGATAALSLNENPAQFLSTVQIGITIVGIFAGVYGGEQLAPVLDRYLQTIPAFHVYSEEIAIATVVSAITYASIVIGELVPKQLAIRHPEPIAVVVSPILVVLARVMSPIVFLLQTSSRLILMLLGAGKPLKPQIIEEEVKELVAEGVREGTLAPQEKEMITGVMRLADWMVRAIKTPAVHVEWLDIDASQQALRESLTSSTVTRLVVAQGSLNRPLGIVAKEDLFKQLLNGQPLDVRAALRDPLYIDDNTSTLRLMELIRRSPVHFAIVLDANAQVSGVVTTFDILKAIVGGFPGEIDAVQAVQRADGSWLMDGEMHLDAVRDIIGQPLLRANPDFHTLAGFMFARFEKVPSEGEGFDWEGYRFEIVDMDGAKIDKAMVYQVQSNPPNPV